MTIYEVIEAVRREKRPVTVTADECSALAGDPSAVYLALRCAEVRFKIEAQAPLGLSLPASEVTLTVSPCGAAGRGRARKSDRTHARYPLQRGVESCMMQAL
jgi:hypothetical protein